MADYEGEPERAWDEYQWERFLQQQEGKAEKYMQLLEEYLDDAKAVIGIGDDVLDVVDGGGQRALERRGDASRHLVRRQAGVLPDHPDHGDPDVGKDVGRRTQRSQRADDQEKQRQHDKRIGPAQRNTYQCDHRRSIPGARRRTGIGAVMANSFGLI